MRAAADRTLGAVLAGGAGSRLGGMDKGLRPLLGRPIVEHVLTVLRPQCDALLVVANRHLDDYSRHAPAIRDGIPGHAGPMAGLVAAFGFLAANRHAAIRWLLTVPVDCPDPPGDLASRLHAAFGAHRNAACAFVRYEGNAQPLFALYRIGDDSGTWGVSAQSALGLHASAMRWHSTLDSVAVDFDVDDTTFHNLNTREDFAKYERMHAGS